MHDPLDQELKRGTTINGRYRIDARIGSGGMGVVYRAFSLAEGRPVALKVLSRAHADPQHIERLRREARIASQARHPNIVEVMDVGSFEGHWYLAMELLDGIDLSDAIALKQSYEPNEMMSVLEPILSAIETAHGLGLVHRDLKPENIFLARRSDEADITVKLLDFGVVKVTNESAEAQLTKTGTVVGTPEYMAPEQARGERVDGRADLYALGCVAYAMLCGTPPFTYQSVFKLLTAQIFESPVPPSQALPTLSPLVDAFVLRAMEKRPEDRFQTAAEMRVALRELAEACGDRDAPYRPITLPDRATLQGLGPSASKESNRTVAASPQAAKRLSRVETRPAKVRPGALVVPPDGRGAGDGDRDSEGAISLMPADVTGQIQRGGGGPSVRGLAIAAAISALVAAAATYLLMR